MPLTAGTPAADHRTIEIRKEQQRLKRQAASARQWKNERDWAEDIADDLYHTSDPLCAYVAAHDDGKMTDALSAHRNARSLFQQQIGSSRRRLGTLHRERDVHLALRRIESQIDPDTERTNAPCGAPETEVHFDEQTVTIIATDLTTLPGSDLSATLHGRHCWVTLAGIERVDDEVYATYAVQPQ